MTKKRTSAKPKAKQGKKATPITTVDVVDEVEPTEIVVNDPEALEVAAASVVFAAPATAARRAGRLSRQQAKTLVLEEEYAYVVKDLRRVFILAGIMFAGLIAANLAFALLGG